MNPFKERIKATKKIAELEAEQMELTKKIGAMNRTPKYQPEYSGAKLGNWQQDAEKMAEKIAKKREELAELVNSDAYIDAVEQASGALLSKRENLRAELERVEQERRDLENGAILAVVGGADALELSERIIALADHSQTLAKAIRYLAMAADQVRQGCGTRQPGPGEPGPWIVDGRGA
jgi:chromosome segregation ATPase